MTPTPSTAQKKTLGKLLLLSYYTTQKKEFRIQIFLGDHPIMGLVCQKMCTLHPLAARTPACAYSNLTWFESKWQFAAAVHQRGVA